MGLSPLSSASSERRRGFDGRKQPHKKEESRGSSIPIDSTALERELIGGILNNSSKLPLIEQILNESCFADPSSREAFVAIRSLASQDLEIDLTSVAEEAKSLGLREVTREFLISAYDCVFSSGSTLKKASMLVDKARRRALYEVSQKIASLALDDSLPSHQAVAEASGLMNNLDFLGGVGNLEKVEDLMSGFVQRVEDAMNHGSINTVPTGFYDVDSITSGAVGGRLIVVAARTSMGKSAFILGLALNMAKFMQSGGYPYHVFVFSLEMSKDECLSRVTAAQSGVPFQRIQIGEFNNNEFENWTLAAAEIAGMPILINDDSNATVDDIVSQSLQAARKYPPCCVVVDHIGFLMQDPDCNEVAALGEVTRKLKILAKKLNCPVFALQQLNRAAENGQDNTPELKHLRGSGKIEENADSVWLLHRPGYYDPTHPDADLMKVIIAKNRGGRRGVTINLAYEPACNRISNLPHSAIPKHIYNKPPLDWTDRQRQMLLNQQTIDIQSSVVDEVVDDDTWDDPPVQISDSSIDVALDKALEFAESPEPSSPGTYVAKSAGGYQSSIRVGDVDF